MGKNYLVMTKKRKMYPQWVDRKDVGHDESMNAGVHIPVLLIRAIFSSVRVCVSVIRLATKISQPTFHYRFMEQRDFF